MAEPMHGEQDRESTPHSPQSESHGPSGAESATPTRPARSFGQRVIAALKLDPTVYEEVEHDPEGLGQAAAVVAFAALATAIGAIGVAGTPGVLGGLVSAFVTWAVWTTLVWLIGVKIFDHSSDFEELLRTLGFVAAPQLLYVLAVVPFAPWRLLVGVVVLAMTVVAFVRAVRHALDVDTGRALLVAALAAGAQFLIVAAFGLVA
ncbi:MAG TPA: YIP1 family protein [Myxococcota bacterium]|nr:YIP1 family protein [Myxococcota bacterium]